MAVTDPSEREVAAAARAIYEVRFNIEFDHASAMEVELSLSSARAALRAAAEARGEDEQGSMDGILDAAL